MNIRHSILAAACLLAVGMTGIGPSVAETQVTKKQSNCTRVGGKAVRNPDRSSEFLYADSLTNIRKRASASTARTITTTSTPADAKIPATPILLAMTAGSLVTSAAFRKVGLPRTSGQTAASSLPHFRKVKMRVPNRYARLLAASRLALLCMLTAAAGPALAEENVVESLELGRLLKQWADEHGHAGRMEGAILALAQNESKRCEDRTSPTPNACPALTQALSLVTRVRKSADSDWRCSEYLAGSRHVDDGQVPHWLIEGSDTIGMFNLSNVASGYIVGGWGKVAIDFYRRGSQAPFETFEFTRTEDQPWGDLVHHADFGAEMSAKLHRALSMGATSITTSFDTSGKPIKTVETSLIGYTRAVKLCGFQ